MNYISLAGFVASVPRAFRLENNLSYTSFRLCVRGSYLDHNGDCHHYLEEHIVICLNLLADFVRSIPWQEDIEVVGELRSRTHVMRVGSESEIEILYPRTEIVANTIRFGEVLVARTDPDDALIALYKSDPA